MRCDRNFLLTTNIKKDTNKKNKHIRKGCCYWAPHVTTLQQNANSKHTHTKKGEF